MSSSDPLGLRFLQTPLPSLFCVNQRHGGTSPGVWPGVDCLGGFGEQSPQRRVTPPHTHTHTACHSPFCPRVILSIKILGNPGYGCCSDRNLLFLPSFLVDWPGVCCTQHPQAGGARGEGGALRDPPVGCRARRGPPTGLRAPRHQLFGAPSALRAVVPHV